MSQQPFVAVDASNNLPAAVRAKQAANLVDPTTVEGGALGTTIATAQEGMGFAECAQVYEYPATGTPVPVESIGGVLYGAVGTTLSKAEDPEGPWTTVATLPGPGTINGLRELGNGEVIASRNDAGLWRSSGWAANPATATWTQALVTNSAVRPFTWDVDPVSGWVVATTYVSGADMSNSRYVWLSKDRGATFNVIFDMALAHPTLAMATSHMHHAVLDKHSPDRMNPRIWVTYHKTPNDPTEATDKLQRQIFTDAPGASHEATTWTIFSHEGVAADHPVIGISTEAGMIFDTDTAPVAVCFVPRTPNPADMTADTKRVLYVLRRDIAMHGWAGRAVAAPDGTVHIGFRSSVAGQPGALVSTDGRTAGEVARIDPIDPTDTVDFLNLTVHEGSLVGVYRQTASAPSVDQMIVASLPKRGVPVDVATDPGGLRGGVAPHSTGVASGLGAEAGPWGAAKGVLAVAGEQSVAIGHKARAATGSLAVTVGESSEAGNQDTNLGAQGKATGYQSVNVGAQGEASANGSVNIGRGGKATHASSVNLGASGATTATNQVQIGARHIEHREAAPGIPAAGAARSYFRTITVNGVAGKLQSAIRFPTGVIMPVATEGAASAGCVRSGTGTMVAGTGLVVTDASITAASIIRVQSAALGGDPGALYVATKTAGTGFTVKSTSGTDSSVVYWEIVAY